jgi:hypothetical protein
MKVAFTLSIAVAIFVTGCAHPNPSSTPSETPPQVVVRNEIRTWDKPQAFGPVPPELAERATQACSLLNTEKARYEARGFHPNALNQAGMPFPGGGFYCTPKS